MFTKGEHGAWKVISQYACGCQIREVNRQFKGSAVVSTIIEYCPKHGAAPKMYEALKAFDEYLSTNYPANIRLKQIATEKLEHALLEAEGKE